LQGVRLGNLTGHARGPPLPIHWWGNIASMSLWTNNDKWGVRVKVIHSRSAVQHCVLKKLQHFQVLWTINCCICKKVWVHNSKFRNSTSYIHLWWKSFVISGPMFIFGVPKDTFMFIYFTTKVEGSLILEENFNFGINVSHIWSKMSTQLLQSHNLFLYQLHVVQRHSYI